MKMKMQLTAVAVLTMLFAHAQTVLELGGEWQVRGEGCEAKVKLPGTLGANRVGKRWT